MANNYTEFAFEFLAIGCTLIHPVDADFKATQRLLERLLESAANRHHLTVLVHCASHSKPLFNRHARKR